MNRTTLRERWLRFIGHTLNRGTIRLGKRGLGPFWVIRHVGRRSGRTYEAPVILARAPEGFVAELTYGDTVNWYRNAVAAGGCVVVRGGREWRVVGIEPYDAERGRAAYGIPARWVLRLLRRTEFRLLRVGR
jgi:deazaflavin-dependent oxidoreductase (nitroreductase family)